MVSTGPPAYLTLHILLRYSVTALHTVPPRYPDMTPNLPTGHNKSGHTKTLQAIEPRLAEPYRPPTPLTAEQLNAPAPTPTQLRENLRRVIAHVITPDKLQLLVWSLYEKARAGDKFAAELVFNMIRGSREDGTVESNTVKLLSPKEIDEELAKLGYVRPSNGVTVKESKS